MTTANELPEVYWLTRDRIGGELSLGVDVWAVQPVRTRFEDGDVVWFAPDDVDIDLNVTCITTWTYADAVKRIGSGAPDTDRECVVVGNPKVLEKLS